MNYENYSSYQFSDIVKDLLEENEISHYKINGEGELTCCCPFHNETHPSFAINLVNGLYYCHSCSAKGNIVQFVSGIKRISISEALNTLQLNGYDVNSSNSNSYYTIRDYAKEKNLDLDYLINRLHIKNSDNGTSIKIPYFNQEGTQFAVRIRHNPKSKSRFSWDKGSKSNLYGLNLLDKFSAEYVILVEGESDCHCAWTYDIFAIGVPGAKNFKKEYSKYFDRFQKIYIHQEPDNGGLEFVKKISQSLPPEKLYTISAFEVDDECKDLADLHKKGKLNLDSLLATTKKIPEIYLKEINRIDENIAEHVKIAEELLSKIYIKFYKQNFYIYENGVYKEGLSEIEKYLLEIDKNLKKNIRSEILDYIRIQNGVTVAEIDKNLINFKNGIYHLDTNTLTEHTPEIFTLCQINANYLTDNELSELITNQENSFIDKFLNDICCGYFYRIDTLLEYIGYSMTYSVDLQRCLFLLGETAGNGKSTFIKLVLELFGKNNCCSISIEEFSERFFGSEIVGKLLNIINEMKNVNVKDIAKFKSVISGDEISVEEKYKARYVIQPFAKHIFAMNSLPNIKDKDEGLFRRLNILPFEAKFSDEEKALFNFENLITQISLDYLANISLRKYNKMLNEHRIVFSNNDESQSYIDSFKAEDNSAIIFFYDVILYARVIDNNNKVKEKDIYDLYKKWCENQNFETLSRKEFIDTALSSGNFKRAPKKDGYPCLEFTKRNLQKF